MHRSESVPATWDAARDEAFFRITQDLLSPRYVELASLLLMTNEPDTADTGSA